MACPKRTGGFRLYPNSGTMLPHFGIHSVEYDSCSIPDGRCYIDPFATICDMHTSTHLASKTPRTGIWQVSTWPEHDLSGVDLGTTCSVRNPMSGDLP
jgi:hypothetical protein